MYDVIMQPNFLFDCTVLPVLEKHTMHNSMVCTTHPIICVSMSYYGYGTLSFLRAVIVVLTHYVNTIVHNYAICISYR